MAEDWKVDDKGDLVIDPSTNDFVTINGIEEIAQRIKATLEIRYHEMMLLDPEMGTDYTDFLGKRFKEEDASMQLRKTIRDNIPEVDSIDNIIFKIEPNRHLKVTFKVTATPTEGTISEPAEGSVYLGD